MLNCLLSPQVTENTAWRHQLSTPRVCPILRACCLVAESARRGPTSLLPGSRAPSSTSPPCSRAVRFPGSTVHAALCSVRHFPPYPTGHGVLQVHPRCHKWQDDTCNCLMEYLVFSMCKLMPSANTEGFTFSFLVWILLFVASLPCLGLPVLW